MHLINDPVKILEDPEVKKYFLKILDEADLHTEDKYNKFIEFFKLRGRIENQVMTYSKTNVLSGENGEVSSALSMACQEIGFWKPREILAETKDTIIRAIGNLKKSQHTCDGGWGAYMERSGFWETAYTVLCLNSAKKLRHFSFNVNIDEMLKSGINWLLKNPREWSVEYLPPDSGISIYHVALAIRCFRQSEVPHPAVSRGVQRIVRSQNEDGGWDASIWGPEIKTPTRVYSEVGATSAAIRALAEIKNMDHKGKVKDAIDWLINTQNPLDGYWKDGSCSPERKEFELGGNPSINKTCDALKGILAGKVYQIDIKKYSQYIYKAVTWLSLREKAIPGDNRVIKGWGWEKEPSASALENTCLTLETLLKMSDALLPLLTTNAWWLMKNQHQEDGSDENGNWKYGLTARITLSLIDYYKTIKKSPLFQGTQP